LNNNARKIENEDAEDAKEEQPQTGIPELTEDAAANENNLDPLPLKKRTIWEKLGLSKRRRYFWAAVFNLTVIWVGAISFVIYTPDKYVSDFTLLIPGAGAGSSISLDDLGQATTSVNSAYTSTKVDPKTNYKAIAMSTVVIEKAAQASGITAQEFGKPKIKLIDQTTLLEISISAGNADAALLRATNYRTALENTLSELRTEELSTRRVANEDVLSNYRKNVDDAQAAVLEFQQQSNIISTEQFDDLVLNVEILKQRKAEALTKLQALSANLEELQNALQTSPADAASAIKLQNDSLFITLVERSAELQTELNEAKAVWGRKHPKVLHANAMLNNARNGLLNRAKELTSIESHEELNDLYISSEGSRSEIFQTLITLTAERSATLAEIESYTEQLAILDSRVHRTASLAATLQDLVRTHQVATTIYVSAAAKTDLGNSDIYASYPMTQILKAPSKPEGPDKFTKPVAVIGALIASVLICLALLLSWKRSVLLQKLQKRN